MAWISTASRVALPLSLIASLIACSDDAPGLSDAVDAGGSNPPADTGVKEDLGADPDMGETDLGAGMDAGAEDMGAAPEPFTTLRNQGLSAQRIDLVFVGDGYTEAELEDVYGQHVEHVADRIFTRRLRGATEPYYQFRAFFNIHRVNLASNESGIDDPATNTEVDTALDGTTGCGLGGCSPSIDTAKVKAAVDAALMGSDLNADVIIVTLNTAEPLEAAIVDANGKFAIYGGGPTDGDDVDTSERGLRQIARVMAGLALGET
ncbi:MAG: M64 family metallopeptidase, partial [Myxococcota bacterium]